MSELEQQLNDVLTNPDMMQKLMAMAQSMGLGAPQASPEPPKQESGPAPKVDMPAGGFGDIDLSMIQKLSGFARQSGIDKNQQTLLHALAPYLSRQRIGKLERAMRAAKMAGFATTFLGR